MYTLSNIVSLAQGFATNHQQINDFFFGHPSELDRDIQYPILMGTLQGSTLAGTQLRTTIKWYILDLPQREEDKNNELEIVSDTRTMAVGFISYFKKTKFQYPLSVDDSASLEDVYDSLDDGAAGWQFDLAFTQHVDLSTCGIPLSDAIADVVNGFGIIFNLETGDTIHELFPNQRYGVLQFSGISGGTPTTVFTNSIVGGTP